MARRECREKDSKQFFFEKKNQKTFINCTQPAGSMSEICAAVTDKNPR
jgi:hypothetical protein